MNIHVNITMNINMNVIIISITIVSSSSSSSSSSSMIDNRQRRNPRYAGNPRNPRSAPETSVSFMEEWK